MKTFRDFLRKNWSYVIASLLLVASCLCFIRGRDGALVSDIAIAVGFPIAALVYLRKCQTFLLWASIAMFLSTILWNFNLHFVATTVLVLSFAFLCGLYNGYNKKGDWGFLLMLGGLPLLLPLFERTHNEKNAIEDQEGIVKFVSAQGDKILLEGNNELLRSPYYDMKGLKEGDTIIFKLDGARIYTAKRK